jgi:hypothetical protein
MSYRADLNSITHLSSQVSKLQRRTTLPPSIELQASEVTTGVAGAAVLIPWAQVIRQNSDTFTWPSTLNPANPLDPNWITFNAPGLYLFNLKLITGTATAYTVSLITQYDNTNNAQITLLYGQAITYNVFTTTLYLYENAKVTIQLSSAPTTLTFWSHNLYESPYLTIVGLSQQWDTPVGKATHIIRNTSQSIATSTNTNITWNNIPANYAEPTIRYLHGVNDLRSFNSVGGAGVSMRAPYNGTYLITATITWDSGTTVNGQRYVWMSINSSANIAAGISTDPSAAVVHPVVLTAIQDMVAGDTVGFGCVHNSASARPILADKGGDFVVTAFNMVMLST